MSINGVGLTLCAVGGVLAYSGVKGYSVSATLRAVITGKDPHDLAQANAIGTGIASVGSTIGNIQAGTGVAAAGQIALQSAAGAGAVDFARAQIGKPYVWGATGPNSYDCSGLVQSAYKSVGISLPRVSQAQVLVGKPVSRASLAIGDLVFPEAGAPHVQIYSGGGNIIEAPTTGIPVREVPMWGFWTARRVA